MWGRALNKGIHKKKEEKRKRKSARKEGKDPLSDSSSPREDLMVADNALNEPPSRHMVTTWVWLKVGGKGAAETGQ